LILSQPHANDLPALGWNELDGRHPPLMPRRIIESFSRALLGIARYRIDPHEASLRWFRSRLLGSACPFAGTWDRYAHHFRHPVAGLLRIHIEGCDDDELQGSFFITDACAKLTDGEHRGTLSAMAHVFCDVRDTQSMLSLIAAA
jgi:hypothetical protein